MSNTSCCVVGCTNRRRKCPEGTKFYRFPRENDIRFPGRREQWKRLVGRQQSKSDPRPWSPSVHSVICSQHFYHGKKSDHPLSPSYNPSIFPGVYKHTPKQNEERAARFERLEKRRRIMKLVSQSAAPATNDVAASSSPLNNPEGVDPMDFLETCWLEKDEKVSKGVQVDLDWDKSRAAFTFTCEADAGGVSKGIMCVVPAPLSVV